MRGSAACPKCNAQPGQPCIQQRGPNAGSEMVKLHIERKQAGKLQAEVRMAA